MLDLHRIFDSQTLLCPICATKSAGLPTSLAIKDFSRVVDTLKTGKSGGYSEQTVFLKYLSTLSSVEEALPYSGE